MDFRNYKIVIAKDAHVDIKAAALRLQAHFKTEEAPLPIVTDDTPETQYEIILGMMNRPECRRIRPDRYLISMKKDKLVIDAINYVTVTDAVNFLCTLAAWQLNAASYKMGYTYVPLTWGEYQLVWNDEFEGDTLNTDKWIGRKETNVCDIEMGMARGSVDIQDSTLVMTAHTTAFGGYTTSAALTTASTMNYQYGYLEIRARVPHRGLGEWPSVRLSNSACKLASEAQVGDAHISVMENASDRFKTKSAVLTYDDRKVYEFSPEEDANDWHTYGCLWTPTEMSFSIDGHFYARNDITDKAECHQPMYLLIQNMLFSEGYKVSMNGTWSKDKPNPQEDLFPCHFDINYCRLYQKPNEGKLYLPKAAGKGKIME